jgi:Tfp pilus assembly protein PilF
MKIKIVILFASVLLYSFNANAALNISQIKLELAKLEGFKDKKVGLAKCENLMMQINEEERGDKNSSEFYTWKGIVTAKMAHYQRSLSLAKEARSLLEKAVAIDEKNSDAAALNALGILYHRVPSLISFGDDKKSEEYFKRAIALSSNIDTNWRYGEFLIDANKKEEGLKLLKSALLKVNSEKQDDKIKEKIIQELIKRYEQ